MFFLMTKLESVTLSCSSGKLVVGAFQRHHLAAATFSLPSQIIQYHQTLETLNMGCELIIGLEVRSALTSCL